MHELWHRARPIARIGMVLGGLVLFAGIALLLGLVVMVLWNWLMPDLFGLKQLSYWQAWGLVLLAHILFKAGPGGRGAGVHRRWGGRRRAGGETPPATA
jgi:hypothetical protein